MASKQRDGGRKGDGRRSARSPIETFQVKGEIVIDGGRRANACLVWDVSDEGLCLWGEAKVKRGQKLFVTLTSPWPVAVACQVRWCREVPGGGGWLIGLQALGNVDDLSLLHQTLARGAKAQGIRQVV